jgi:hypothetical protein
MGEAGKQTGAVPPDELEQEAQERGTVLDEAEAPGHTLPESERDRTVPDRPAIPGSPILPPD